MLNDTIYTHLEYISLQRPTVVCLSNAVSLDFVASVLLAIGAKPLFTESLLELKEYVSRADALLINIGTLDNEFMQRASEAINLCKKNNVPVIFDPFDCGLTELRNKASMDIIPSSDIVRGNEFEILSLFRMVNKITAEEADKKANKTNSKKISDIENIFEEPSIQEAACILSKKYNSVVAVSGADDVVCFQGSCVKFSYGSPMMNHIYGIGCALNAVIAVFSSVESNYFLATESAMKYYSYCGERSAMQTLRPSLFRNDFIDQIYFRRHI